MTLLSLSQVERNYGDRTIFSGVSLRIDDKDRIGIIGDNGAGKTTLVHILTGKEPPDRGERAARRDLRMAWTEQIPDLAPGTTILEAARTSFRELEQMEVDLRDLEEQMARTPEDERLLHRHERIHTAFEASGGYERDRFAERALLGLGFTIEDFDRDVAQLSGGQKARVALARVMLLPAELLILDEPTNHLDLDGIAFLEDWLCSRTGAFVVVSHDRRFLDRVCESIVDVEFAGVTRYKGNYSQCRTQKEARFEATMREFQKQQDFIAKETAFIKKHMGSQRTAEAKGRLKRLNRIQQMARPRKKGDVRLRLTKGHRGLQGQTLVEGEGLSYAWPGHDAIFAGFDFRVYHGDRVGILGRNGIGKSTLLKLISGELRPTAGKLDVAQKLRIARFTQEMEDLPSHGNVYECLQALVPTWVDQDLRDHLGAFGFTQDEIEKDVNVLSGGEKRRLCLARLTCAEFDLLLLDEPTNHLDISTREAFEQALDAYPGTLVMVSHDRWFLDKMATRIFEMEEDQLRTYEDGLAYYLVKREERKKADQRDRGQERDGQRRDAGDPESGQGDDTKTAGSDSGKIRNPYAFAKLEQDIMELETRLAEVQLLLNEPDAWKDPESLKQNQSRQEEIEAELADYYERWENWQ